MNKDIRKILWVTALYSFAGGIFYNFEELWLLQNNFTTSEVSFIISIGALITAFSILLFSYVIKQKNIQNILLSLLIIKAIIFYLIYQINGLGFKGITSFLFIIDFSIDTEIYVLLYPLIASIKSDNELYAKRGLTYEAFYYLAMFISGLLIGKRLLTYKFTYNSFGIIGTFILFIAVVVLLNVNVDRYIKKEKPSNKKVSLINLLKKIPKDKVSLSYLLYLFFYHISRYCIIAITMIILTTELNLTSSMASNTRLLFCIIAVFLASIAIRKFTFKNNYINIFIKFGIRLLIYLFAIFNFEGASVLLAIAYTYITDSLYTHVIDGKYVNRFEKEEQIVFINFRESTGYFSRAIGTLICGLCISISLRLNIIVASIVLSFCIIFAMLANYYSLQKK